MQSQIAGSWTLTSTTNNIQSILELKLRARVNTHQGDDQASQAYSGVNALIAGMVQRIRLPPLRGDPSEFFSLILGVGRVGIFVGSLQMILHSRLSGMVDLDYRAFRSFG